MPLRIQTDLGFDYTPLRCETLDKTVEAVASGRADAFVYMASVMRYYNQARGQGDVFRSIEPPLTVSKISIAFVEFQSPLQAMLSRGVEESRQEGAACWIIREWVGPEYRAIGSQILRRIQYIIYGLVLLVVALLLFWLWDIHLTHSVRDKIRALQENERRLSFLFEEIPHIAVKGYNAKREAIFWNRAAEILYGYSKAEALGKKREDLVLQPSRCENAISAFDAWAETGAKIPSGEMIKRHADGQEVAVYSCCFEMRNQHGEREMYVIDIDLSTLKRANEELVSAKEFAERASRANTKLI